MRIAQINTGDADGGAAGIAMALHRQYRLAGHDASLIVGYQRTDEPGVVRLDRDANRGVWFRFWRAAAKALEPTTDGRPKADRLRRAVAAMAQPRRWVRIRLGHEDFNVPATWRIPELLGTAPDVMHAHNLHPPGDYFDLRALPVLSRDRPFFLTLHDAWLLSGHCAHSFACDRWLNGCGNCPDLSLYPRVRRDATAGNWRRKRSVYAGSHLHIATPCGWLKERVERSMLAAGDIDVRVIPNGIDLDVFHPGEKEAARRELGLRSQGTVVIIPANAFSGAAYRDLALTQSTIEAVATTSPGTLFVAVGADGSGRRWRHPSLRFVSELEHSDLARYFRAADVYIHPARADTFPTIILESLACGTPVVATRVGGISEQIVDGETGALVADGDARGFTEALTCLLDDAPRRETMGAAAAVDVARRFEQSQMSNAYLAWYAEAIESRARAGS